MNHSKVTVITGPQGSGNHLFAKVLSLHSTVGGWKELHNQYWLGHDKEPYTELWNDFNLIDTYNWSEYSHNVISISCPYVNNGETTIPDYLTFIQKLQRAGLSVNVGIIGRDVNILQAQQQRVRGNTSLQKFLEQLDILLNFEHVFLSHELLSLYKYKYLASVAKMLDLPLANEDKILPHLSKNSNEKYISYVDHYWLDDEAKKTSLKWK